MNPISVAAASGLRARMEALDLLSNNLANAATDGYKGDRELYNIYVGRATGDLGDAKVLPVIEKQWTDFSQGLLQTTDNPLDLALKEEGFFAVNGPSGPLYTRNGSFELSREGVLQTRDGYTVRLAGGDKTLRVESPAPISVSSDGTVRQADQTLGRLEVVRFDDPAVLSKHGSNYFRTSAADAASAAQTEILQGTLEASNVSTAESAMRIVSVMRQFEILQKAISLAGEMDRQVVSEVARVGS